MTGTGLVRPAPPFLPLASAFIMVVVGVQGSPATAADEPMLAVSPAAVSLSGDAPRQQVLATLHHDGRPSDVTRDARFAIADAGIAAIDGQNCIHALNNGATELVVEFDGQRVAVPVTVTDLHAPRPIDFERDVQPVFSRLGCNAGACHGKQGGQNGFALSLLGFDPDFDHAALAQQGRSRRIFFPAPEQSLLLRKPTGLVPHGGGVRMEPGGSEYHMLLDWVRDGAPRSQTDAPELVGIDVTPTDRILDRGDAQQLVVTATYDDGSTRDVTFLATYQSNEATIAGVDESGLVTAGQLTGEAAIMCRYQGNFAVFTASVPLPGDVPNGYYASLPRHNFIDEHVWQALERLGLQASDPASDEKFLRRVSIDIIGRTPTTEEARTFLNDPSPERRTQLVDGLLNHPEYAEHWANKWADLLRPNPYRVGIKTTLNYDAWIRDAFRKNRPYDEFVRELITAEGSTFRNGAVTLFRDRRSPDEITTIVSQLFLGVRLECAKCHHHPFEVYGQEDFYSFAAYFAKVDRKGTGLSPPISGSEEFVYAGSRGSVEHPLTGETLEPQPLFGEAPAVGRDPRESLAAWIASPDNPYFAQTQSNRIWADLMGRGLVEPVDDLRATNPPSNAPLLEALGRDFAENGFDNKQLIRRIVLSHAYGLSSLPNERNIADLRYYSRHYRQQLRAEVLLDSVCQITGVPESFDAMPPGAQARELWSHRIESLFLDAFGRPDPNQDPPCERITDPTVVQTLHLMNSEDLFRKVASDDGRAAELAAGEMSPAEIVEELYLSVYSRRPDEVELQIGVGLYENEGSDRRRATEDLLWALLNTPEFVFKD